MIGPGLGRMQTATLFDFFRAAAASAISARFGQKTPGLIRTIAFGKGDGQHDPIQPIQIPFHFVPS
jgi:hypothetical protein